MSAAYAAAQAGTLGVGFRCGAARRGAAQRAAPGRRAAAAAGRARAPPPPPPGPPPPPSPPPSGGGFIIPFFLGVIDVLQKQGIIKPGMPMAGASSGALAIM
jgi:hypothetical protein